MPDSTNKLTNNNLSKPKQLGKNGEILASQYLTNNKYIILNTNWRSPNNKKNIRGEIDIVAYKNNSIIIIEVKTRKNYINGYPSEAINIHKYNKLRKLSACYMSENIHKLSKYKVDQVRIDAISIIVNYRKVKIFHIKNTYY